MISKKAEEEFELTTTEIDDVKPNFEVLQKQQ
jgi:hypothetical protein